LLLPGRGLGFQAHFIRPVQRLAAYSLLLGRLIKVTEFVSKDHLQLPNLRLALQTVDHVVQKVDQIAQDYHAVRKLEDKIDNLNEGLAKEGRSVLHCGPLSQPTLIKGGHRTRIETIAYLLTDMLLLVVEQKPHSTRCRTSCLEIYAKVMLWNCRCEPRGGMELEVHYTHESGTTRVMVLAASSMGGRDNWLRKVREAIAAMQYRDIEEVLEAGVLGQTAQLGDIRLPAFDPGCDVEVRVTMEDGPRAYREYTLRLCEKYVLRIVDGELCDSHNYKQIVGVDVKPESQATIRFQSYVPHGDWAVRCEEVATFVNALISRCRRTGQRLQVQFVGGAPNFRLQEDDDTSLEDLRRRSMEIEAKQRESEAEEAATKARAFTAALRRSMSKNEV